MGRITAAMIKSLGAKTLIYPAPVLVVGTYDKAGKPNVMTASWGGICCSQPPCVAVSLRNATCSHGNIVDRGAFTVSVPSEKHIKEVDYFGLVSGRSMDKFAATSSRCRFVARAAARSAVVMAACKSPASACAAARVPMSKGLA